MSAVTVFISSGLLEVFELTMARALDLWEEGDEVSIVYCDGLVYAACTANPFGWSSICRVCRSIYDEAFSALPADIIARPITFYQKFTQFENVPGWQLGDQEVKNGVESTLLTNYRVDRQRIASSLLLRHISRRYEIYSKLIFESAISVLKSSKIDRLEFYNGRLVPTRALLTAARLTSTDFSVLESWGVNRSMRIYPNTTPHEFQYNKLVLENFIPLDAYDEEIGHKFFIDRRKGLPTNDRSYTARQTSKVKLSGFSRPLIAFFLSSPDELKVSGNEFFTTWSLAPEIFIAEVYRSLRFDFDFVVRMHPNQHGDRTGESARIHNSLVSLPGVCVIKPLDPTSSYELMGCADYVVTFGSTIGIEATYWGKTSILVGRALWEDANVVYKCKDPSSFIKLIRNNPEPLSRESSVKIGYHFMVDINKSKNLRVSRLGFHILDKNYLPLKRRGLVNIFNKLIERVMRSRFGHWVI